MFPVSSVLECDLSVPQLAKCWGGRLVRVRGHSAIAKVL